MAVKAKRFRIGVEGATTDGREISREWLEQMAAAYNPAVYTATINLEHIKSYSPDSTFNRYGTVSALGTEEINDGPLAGKLALYADILPTDSLVALVKQGHKLFTSMEVSTKFADTGKAYLVGLAGRHVVERCFNRGRGINRPADGNHQLVLQAQNLSVAGRRAHHAGGI
jgi:hypothetical protein